MGSVALLALRRRVTHMLGTADPSPQPLPTWDEMAYRLWNVDADRMWSFVLMRGSPGDRSWWGGQWARWEARGRREGRENLVVNHAHRRTGTHAHTRTHTRGTCTRTNKGCMCFIEQWATKGLRDVGWPRRGDSEHWECRGNLRKPPAWRISPPPIQTTPAPLLPVLAHNAHLVVHKATSSVDDQERAENARLFAGNGMPRKVRRKHGGGEHVSLPHTINDIIKTMCYEREYGRGKGGGGR